MEHNKSPLAMYDITAPCDRYTLDQMKEWFRLHCKRWCFQQERSDNTGYLHWQCRISLISKKRADTMRHWIANTMTGWHESPTSNPSFHSGDEFYVIKVDTRINGPWSDRDDVNPNNIPKRLRNDNMTWRPWQQSVINLINEEPDDRTVNIIINPTGQVGKSTLALWLMARKKAQRIPQQKDARDIMRMIMCCPIRSCYFIDLPKATSHRDMHSIYAAIEEIKNGYAYDDRYKFTEKLFEPPHIWVFTNVKPDEKLLSRDRWKYWSINSQLQLVEHSDTIPSPSSLEIASLSFVNNQLIRLQSITSKPLTLNVIREHT